MATPSHVDSAFSKEWSDPLPSLKQWAAELEDPAESHRRAARNFRNLNRFLGGLNDFLAALTASNKTFLFPYNPPEAVGTSFRCWPAPRTQEFRFGEARTSRVRYGAF
jgi:hypothetical protein